ncbi:MAG: hypothetical protein C0478_17360 [Planctomyces sp.]|nr:hypothetical protein [Planctomyces sp.]
MQRQTVSTGTHWEKVVAYSRAVRIGPHVYVSGTTASNGDGTTVAVGDAYQQTAFILRKIETALAEVGAKLSDVARTRMFVTDISRWEEIGSAHGEVFAGINPAATMVEIRRLVSPDHLVEIEVDAVVNPNSQNINPDAMKASAPQSISPVKIPRLEELAQSVSDSSYEGWFANLPQKLSQSSLAAEWYANLEKELSALEAAEWATFKDKIAKQSNSNRKELLSLFNEAAGYARFKEMLKERGIPYDTIQHPVMTAKKGRKPKEPEWIALHGDQIIAAIEVKTAFESDDQNHFIESNTIALESGGLPEVRRVTPSIPDGLLHKCSSHVKKAKEQLRSVGGEPRLLVAYVIVNVDYEAAQLRDCVETIRSHLERLSESDVLVVGDIRSPFF